MWRSDDRRLRRMEWLIVSKAADRSKKRRIVSWLESEASRRSLVIFKSAVSVLCFLRNPDWNGSRRLLDSRWAESCEATTRSMILDRNGRLEIGRKLLGQSGSRPGFFKIGVMAASLRDEGTEPEMNEELMIDEMRGEMEGRQCLMR